MNDTTRTFPRSIEEVKQINPLWHGLNASEANPFKGPFDEHGYKVKSRLSWPIIGLCFFVTICLYLGAIMYLHVVSAAGPAFREVMEKEALDKRMQIECGENTRVYPIGNGYWKCEDKRGRVSKTLKE